MSDTEIDFDALRGLTLTDELSTEYFTVPEGEYTDGYIESMDFRSVNTQDGARIIIRWGVRIENEELLQMAERDKVIVKHEAWLRLDESGSLSKKDNQQLGQALEAFGMNKAGLTLDPDNFVGIGPFGVVVKHRDGKDGRVFAEVSRIFAQV